MLTPLPTVQPEGAATAASATRGRRGRWWSSRSARTVTEALGAVLMETLPVAAWLYTAAAFLTGDSGHVALPLWYLVGATCAALAIGRWLRRAAAGMVLLVALPFFLGAEVVAWRVSPAGYAGVPGGPFDLSWVGALGDDLLAGASHVADLLGLAVLTGYLWWRGLRLGRAVLAVETVRRTFAFSLAAVIAALAVAAVVPGAGQAALAGRLGLLLPVEVFAGLVTLALTRAMTVRTASAPGNWVGAASDAPWLSLAIVLSGVIVGLTLVLSLVLSFGTISAALDALGPVGLAIVAGIQWLLLGFAYLLYFVLGIPINYITSLLTRQRRIQPYQPPAPPKGACKTPNCAPNLPPAHGIVVAVVLGLVVLGAIALLAYIAYRSLREVRSHTAEADRWDERESLDGRALLGAQLRALLGGLRARGTDAVERLAAGSVRRIYRDVLQAAAAVGLGRHASETPDEYARRLETMRAVGGGAPDGSLDDLTALTHAYDAARYAEHEPDAAELRDLRAGGDRLRASLRARDVTRRA